MLAADLELGRIRPGAHARNGGTVEQRLSSSALATTTCRTSRSGRLLFDTMNLVAGTIARQLRSTRSLPSHRRRQGRHHAGDIFRAPHAGDDDDRAVVAKYCKTGALQSAQRSCAP
jgi:hypothetical protein